jgi:ferredoxin-NADP reductase
MTVLTRVLSALTTPLLPEDYLGLVNPLWSTSQTLGRVVGVRRETADAATLAIRPGVGWREPRPGQWTRVGVDIDGVRHWRSYSLSGGPGTVQITVKAQGLVSDHLVHRTRPGAILALGGPEGDFVLPAEGCRPLFVTAGSGITPVMAMLRAGTPGLEEPVLVHSAPSRPSVIFGPELRRMDGLRLVERHTRKEGRLEPAMLEKLVPDLDERRIYACGPEEMLRALEEHFPSVTTERFRLAATAVGEGGEVSFTRSGVTAETAGPILDAGEAAGALLPSGCRMGICFSCVGKLTSGKVRDLRSGQVHGDPGDLVQTCVSAPAGPCEIDL